MASLENSNMYRGPKINSLPESLMQAVSAGLEFLESEPGFLRLTVTLIDDWPAGCEAYSDINAYASGESDGPLCKRLVREGPTVIQMTYDGVVNGPFLEKFLEFRGFEIDKKAKSESLGWPTIVEESRFRIADTDYYVIKNEQNLSTQSITIERTRG